MGMFRPAFLKVGLCIKERKSFVNPDELLISRADKSHTNDGSERVHLSNMIISFTNSRVRELFENCSSEMCSSARG
jgi:hypothetical protein